MILSKHTILFSLAIIINLLLLSISTLIFDGNELISDFYNIFGYVIILWIVYTWRKESGERLFCPYLIFMCFFVIFNYGQPLLWALGLYKDRGLISGTLITGTSFNIDNTQLIKLKHLSCIAMISIHIGGLLSVSKNKMFRNDEEKKEIEDTKNRSLIDDSECKSMLFTGVLFGSFSIPLTIYRYIYFLSIARNRGYGAIYYNNDFSLASLTFIIEMFFFPSLLCILIGGKFKKHSQIIVWLIFLTYTIINILMGDRGTWLYKLVVLIWLELDHYNKRHNHKIIWYSVIGIVLLYFVYAIVGLRDTGNITFDSVIDNLENVDFPVFTAIYEMGGSMKILGYMVVYGTSFWTYSNSYLTAFLGVITSRFFHIFGIKLVLVDDYFTSYLNLDYGSGFSMIGEAYMNFQSCFFIVLIVFGFVFANLFSRKRNKSLDVFIAGASLAVLTGWIRGSSYLYFKSFFYGVIVFVLLIKLLSKNLFSPKKAL